MTAHDFCIKAQSIVDQLGIAVINWKYLNGGSTGPLLRVIKSVYNHEVSTNKALLVFFGA